MEFLGIGPLELFFILIIALIVLGPRDMVKTGRMLGKYLRKIVMSPTWRTVQQTSRELRTLPNRMIREAGMEEDIKDLDQLRKDLEKQVGSISKPISAAAGEVNASLQAVNRDLSVQTGPATQTKTATTSQPATEPEPSPQNKPDTPAEYAKPNDLSAWTTTPPTEEPGADSTLVPDNTAPAEENQNPEDTS
jgi:Sec-independent protein translocase protein TatA